LINRQEGSWFFIGELLTNLECEYDSPVTDLCGGCNRCVRACPTGALSDNPHEKPQLGFTEMACIQCGLCRNTCPESAITLETRLDFRAEARQRQVLHEEEPFACIRCGAPFGTRSTIERLTERLAGHAMFAGPGRIDLIRMCEECRVKAQSDLPQPLAVGVRPRVRTTDDDLREWAAGACEHETGAADASPGNRHGDDRHG